MNRVGTIKKILDQIQHRISTMILGIRYIFNYFKKIDNYVVKSDEDELQKLLKKPEDKLKFEKAIDELTTSNKSSTNIEINNRQITISI